MKLVDNAGKAWRWFSVQMGAVATVLPLAWTALPDETKAVIPSGWLPWIVSAVGVAVVVGRLIDQGGDT